MCPDTICANRRHILCFKGQFSVCLRVKDQCVFMRMLLCMISVLTPVMVTYMFGWRLVYLDQSHTVTLTLSFGLNSLPQTLPLFTLASVLEIKLQTLISFFTTLLWIVRIFPFVQRWARCDGNMCMYVCGHSGSCSLIMRHSHIIIQYHICFVFW